MDTISIKVNLVVVLKDGYTNSGTLKGVVTVRTHNGICAIKKDNSCYVFANCTKGLYRITIEASDYISQSFDVYMDEQVRVMNITLMPANIYKFHGNTTKLYGRLDREAYAAFVSNDNMIRLLDDFKKGDSKLKIFFSDPEFSGSEQFYISCKDKSGIYSLEKSGNVPMTYKTDKPLEFDIDTSAVIGKVYKVTGDENGEYFIAVKGLYKKAFLVTDDECTEIPLSGTETKYDFKEI